MATPPKARGSSTSQLSVTLEGPSVDGSLLSEMGISTSVEEPKTHFKAFSEGSALADLPTEIFDHVLKFLGHECPSELNWHQRPDLNLTKSPKADLKNLSLASKSIRSLTRKRLFAHVCLDPNQSPAFLDFVYQYALAPHITSILARITEPCRLILHPLWWARLLNAIPALTFTVICPPSLFMEFVATEIVMVDSWAFNMPFHTIRFRQSKLAALQSTSFNDDHDLFSARPWTEFSINEGSNLKVYTEYEYYRRQTPSLMSAILDSPSPGVRVMLAKLEKFTYTAIFPFYEHVDEVLKSVRKMTNLKLLRFRLCPDSESSVVEDEMAGTEDLIIIHEAWSSFISSYNLVAYTVRFLSVYNSLQEFQIEDALLENSGAEMIESMNGIIDNRIPYQGNGVWRKIQPNTESQQNVSSS